MASLSKTMLDVPFVIVFQELACIVRKSLAKYVKSILRAQGLEEGLKYNQRKRGTSIKI